MSEPNDTAPAAETEIAAPASISEIIAGRSDALHDGHKEVGAETPAPKPEPASAPAAPAPAAATTPAPAETDPANDPKAPKWYREHMRKTNAELAALKAERTAPRPADAPAPQPARINLPNPAEDPAGYANAIQQSYQQAMNDLRLQTKLDNSEFRVRSKHGDEAFEETFAWLSTQPNLEAHFIRQPDPWGAAIAYFQREKLAEEIGDNPDAWREKERQRIRDEILAEQAAGATERPPAAMAPQRSAPPAPASTARSTAPRDTSGRFTGPQPIGSLSKHKFS